jgi:ADP-ribose pyrophosphatase YjhB (NUDIX family)
VIKTKRYAGVAVKCEDKILLCKRSSNENFPNMWSIPAGHLEKNETIQDCAKREFFEETNLNVNDYDLKFIGLVPRYTKNGNDVKGLMYVYLLEVDDQINPDLDLAKDGHEHTECGYFSINEIDEYSTGTQLFKLIQNILK